MERYYRILGIKPTDSLETARKAYRSRSKQLHPDRNKAANAHEQFILLNEAFQYVEDLKTGKLKARRRPTNKPAEPDKSSGRAYEEWVRSRGAEARARAQQQAKMRYAEYLKSDQFKTFDLADNLLNLAFFAIVFCIILGIVLGLSYSIFGVTLKTSALIAAYLATLALFKTFAPGHEINPLRILPKLRYLFLVDIPQLILLSLINLIVFLYYPFSSITNHLFLIALLVIPCIAIGQLVNGKKKLILLMLFPTVFNAFFIVNDVFSSKQQSEVVVYEIDRRRSSGSSLVTLKNDVFDSSFGIRMYGNYSEVDNAHAVEYTTVVGFFGVPIVKNEVVLNSAFKPKNP